MISRPCQLSVSLLKETMYELISSLVHFKFESDVNLYLCKPLYFWLQCLEADVAKTEAPMETEVTNSAAGQVRYFN